LAEIAERLRGELSDMLEVIRRADGGMFEECPATSRRMLPPDEAMVARVRRGKRAA
jgi:hypothetical protein